LEKSPLGLPNHIFTFFLSQIDKLLQQIHHHPNMKVSALSLVAIIAGGTDSFLAHARLNDESSARELTTPEHGRYQISLRSPSTACPDGRILAQVLDWQGQPVLNAKVQFLMQDGSDQPYRRTLYTNRNGRAAFDFVLRDTTLGAGDDMSCSIKVTNPNLFQGYEVVPCTRAIQVCPGQPCSVNSGSVLCQDDMMFDNECRALAYGMDLADDCQSNGCSSYSGEVVCQGDILFESECKAQDVGMNLEEECEPAS